MNIVVIGAGYVGLVTGACFAELGHQVTCVEVDKQKVKLLLTGISPIYEPGLQQLIVHNMNEKRLQFVNTLQEVTHPPHVIFIAVGTPSDTDGSVDTRFVLEAADEIGNFISADCIVVNKSTVPVGSGDNVRELIQDKLQQRQLAVDFDVVSNPEFLREGAAIVDFMRPDRVICGAQTPHAQFIMMELYRSLITDATQMHFMTLREAEMTKYVANAMLAARISFMNEMAVLCEALNVDVDSVKKGISADQRIGSAFLNAGCGYGGSCFPKDVRALIHLAQVNQLQPIILQAVDKRNQTQKQLLGERIAAYFGDQLPKATIAIWGLAFKPGTDDMREASSLCLIDQLMAMGAVVQAYDPVSVANTKRLVPPAWYESGRLNFFEHAYDALTNADALVLVTEWPDFDRPNLVLMKQKMRKTVIFDGRNLFDPVEFVQAGFDYYGIGKGMQTTSMAEVVAA